MRSSFGKERNRKFVVVRKLQNFGVGFAFSAESFGQKKAKEKKNSIFCFLKHTSIKKSYISSRLE